MMFLIRFWRSLTKKDSVESAKYEGEKKFLLVLQFFYVFLRIRIQIFPDQIQILAGLDPDSKKKSDPDPKKPLIQNTAFNIKLFSNSLTVWTIGYRPFMILYDVISYLKIFDLSSYQVSHLSRPVRAQNKNVCIFWVASRPSVYIVHVVPVWGLSVAMFTRTFNTPPPPPIVLCDVVCECTRQETSLVRAGYLPPSPHLSSSYAVQPSEREVVCATERLYKQGLILIRFDT